MTYNVVKLVPGEQQRDSFYTHPPPPYFLRFFSIITRHWLYFPVLYNRSLSVTYFIYSSVYLLIPKSWFHPPFPFGNHKFKFICIFFFFQIPHISNYLLFIFVWLTLLSMIILGLLMLLQKSLFHMFLWLSNISVCVCVCVHPCVHIHWKIYIYIYIHTQSQYTSSVSIHLWRDTWVAFISWQL